MDASNPNIETGQISSGLLQRLVPDHAERSIFMCVPEGFMKVARSVAEELPFAAIHEESFGEKITCEETEGTGGEVFFSLSGKSGNCLEGETL